MRTAITAIKLAIFAVVFEQSGFAGFGKSMCTAAIRSRQAAMKAGPHAKAAYSPISALVRARSSVGRVELRLAALTDVLTRIIGCSGGGMDGGKPVAFVAFGSQGGGFNGGGADGGIGGSVALVAFGSGASGGGGAGDGATTISLIDTFLPL